MLSLFSEVSLAMYFFIPCKEVHGSPNNWAVGGSRNRKFELTGEFFVEIFCSTNSGKAAYYNQLLPESKLSDRMNSFACQL